MKTSVTGRHVEITPGLRGIIARKLVRVERILNDSAVSVQVVLTQEHHRCCAEVVLHARGDHMLHGEEKGRPGSRPSAAPSTRSTNRRTGSRGSGTTAGAATTL